MIVAAPCLIRWVVVARHKLILWENGGGGVGLKSKRVKQKRCPKAKLEQRRLPRDDTQSPLPMRSCLHRSRKRSSGQARVCLPSGMQTFGPMLQRSQSTTWSPEEVRSYPGPPLCSAGGEPSASHRSLAPLQRNREESSRSSDGIWKLLWNQK